MSHYEIWSRAEDFGNLSSMFCFTSMVAVLVASLVSFSILVINDGRSKTYGAKRVKDQLSREQVDLVVKRQVGLTLRVCPPKWRMFVCSLITVNN